MKVLAISGRGLFQDTFLFSDALSSVLAEVTWPVPAALVPLEVQALLSQRLGLTCVDASSASGHEVEDSYRTQVPYSCQHDGLNLIDNGRIVSARKDMSISEFAGGSDECTWTAHRLPCDELQDVEGEFEWHPSKYFFSPVAFAYVILTGGEEEGPTEAITMLMLQNDNVHARHRSYHAPKWVEYATKAQASDIWKYSDAGFYMDVASLVFPAFPRLNTRREVVAHLFKQLQGLKNALAKGWRGKQLLCAVLSTSAFFATMRHLTGQPWDRWS